MPKLVANGAKLRCTEGLAPAVLTALPISMAEGGIMPAGTVMDHLPMVNIAPFGMCKTQAKDGSLVEASPRSPLAGS